MRTPLLLLLSLLLSSAAWAADNDGDGVPNALDNCIEVSNNDAQDPQIDSDGDGFGNRCDGDHNQDGVVGGPDLAIWRAELGNAPAVNPAVDMDSDGTVGTNDFTLMVPRLRLPPGPAGFNRTVPLLPAAFGLALALGLLAVGRRARRGRGATAGALLACLLLGARAEAGGTLSFIWTATTGTGTTGGNFIDAQVGDQLTGELRIQPDAVAVVFASASLRFDTDLSDELDLLSVTVPAFQIVDGIVVLPLFPAPKSTTESTSTTAGEILSCDQTGDLFGPTSPTVTEFVLCEVQFEVTPNAAVDGADIEIGLYNTGYDSINDEANNAQTSLPVTPVAGIGP